MNSALARVAALGLACSLASACSKGGGGGADAAGAGDGDERAGVVKWLADDGFRGVTVTPGAKGYAFRGIDKDGHRCDGTVKVSADAYDMDDDCSTTKTTSTDDGTGPCAADHVNACWYEGMKAWSDKRYDAAQPPLRTACGAKDADACRLLAIMAQHGQGMPATPELAAGLFGQACDFGDAVSCDRLGTLLAVDGASDKDLATALAAFQRSCTLDDGDGCDDLGAAYYRGAGTTKDLSKVVPTFKRSCDLGCAFGCHDLGLAYEHGIGVPADTKLATESYVKACAAGDKDDCKP